MSRHGITVDDGHGRLLRSGTHARVFNASFVSASSNTVENSEKYHGRIASALDIDRVRRIFEFNSPAIRYPPLSTRNVNAYLANKAIWNGFRWVNENESSSANCQSTISIATRRTELIQPRPKHHRFSKAP